MRKNQTNQHAGNCNCCCLIPALLLVVLAIAALIGLGLVGKSALNISCLGSADHRSDAYNNGCKEGETLGAESAVQGDQLPSEQDLDALALREADKLHITHGRRQWLRGFKSGFAHGFKKVNKQASRIRLPVAILASCGN